MSHNSASIARGNVLWITRTAIFIALLIGAQIITRPLGTYVTGSMVNMILAVAVMTAGLSTGLTVAVLSNMFALLFGIIPPLVQVLPVVAMGNALFVFLWHIIGNANIVNTYVSRIIALVAAAVGKFLVLFFGVVHFVLPTFGDQLPAPAAETISVVFSVHQLITASIGGALAFLIIPVVKKATRR